MIRNLGLFTCLCVLGSVGWADQVILKNGDSLTGTIVKLTDSKLVFKSDLAGEVTIDLSGIRTLASDEPLTIHLKDGTVLQCQVTSGQGDQFDIASSAVQAQSLNTEDITAINPPAKPVSKWEGQVSGGLTSSHGNTKSDSQNLSLRTKKRTKIDRTTITADYVQTRQEDTDTGDEDTTEDWWRTTAKYDYFLSGKWYAFVDGRYERDAVASLDRRMVIGGGAGWQWIDTERTQWSLELGGASLYEKFDNATESNSELSAQLGYNLEHNFTKNVELIHDLTYYPSTDRFSDYFLTSGAEIRAHFSSRMFANFKALFNYDASPAIGKGNTDVKYIVGVGLDF
jgi:putative salt-induced outer membrane protein YdiY